jgi:hypothetical protein
MQRFDKASNTLDDVSFKTQKVVSSSMEEEVHGPESFVLIVMYYVS